jgi:Enoyl-CoA hydratase/isomerase
MADTVSYELDGHVATITYDRPHALNAVNGELRADLNDAFARFRDEEDAWVAIVTGRGRAFCAGADLRDGAGSTGVFAGTFWEKPTLNSFESGWEIFKPVIAAVNGYCLGYGLTLVTWCDFVIASDRAEFGYPEVMLGGPAAVGALRLPDRLAVRHGVAAHRGAHRRPPGQGDRPRRLGGAPRRPDGRGPATGRPADGRLAAGATGDEGDRHALPSPPATRGGALRRDDAQGGRRHRRRR